MNDFNQQYAGMMDCGCQSGQNPMPVWQNWTAEDNRFGWPSSGMPDMDCQTPPSAVMPAWSAQQPQVQQPQMQQPAQQPQTQQPVNFAARMEAGCFPLAMSYVPIQQWSQPSPLEEGFRRGTIFAELDLPFMMGRCR